MAPRIGSVASCNLNRSPASNYGYLVRAVGGAGGFSGDAASYVAYGVRPSFNLKS